MANPQINELRAGFDLPAVDDGWHPLRGIRIGVVPELFDPEGSRLPNARYYRTSLVEAEAEQMLDAELVALPSDRPVVLASLGANGPVFDRTARRGWTPSSRLSRTFR